MKETTKEIGSGKLELIAFLKILPFSHLAEQSIYQTTIHKI